MFKKQEKRFQTKETLQNTLGGAFEVVVDTVTGVNYLMIVGSAMYGITPLLDENGNVVPDASEFVSFSASAPARIIGTGSDNCDHNKVTNTGRKMYMGKILVAVKPQKGQKKLKLTAMSNNCGVTVKSVDL